MKSNTFKGSLKYSYKKLENRQFSNALREELKTLESETYGDFGKKFTDLLNITSPIKSKIIRLNSNVIMTKELRKEVMEKSKLRNKFNTIAIMKIDGILSYREITMERF